MTFAVCLVIRTSLNIVPCISRLRYAPFNARHATLPVPGVRGGTRGVLTLRTAACLHHRRQPPRDITGATTLQIAHFDYTCYHSCYHLRTFSACTADTAQHSFTPGAVA